MNAAAPGPVEFVLLAAAVITALGAIYRYAVRPGVRLVRSTWRFLEDWNGTPARPGYDAVPGVLERVHRIESEVTHNGGSSLKDAVVRTEKTLKEHLEDADAVKLAAHAEALRMWAAIEAVAKSTPAE